MKVGGDGVGLMLCSLRLCLFMFFVSFLVYSFVHYEHLPRKQSKQIKLNLIRFSNVKRHLQVLFPTENVR